MGSVIFTFFDADNGALVLSLEVVLSLRDRNVLREHHSECVACQECTRLRRMAAALREAEPRSNTP